MEDSGPQEGPHLSLAYNRYLLVGCARAWGGSIQFNRQSIDWEFACHLSHLHWSNWCGNEGLCTQTIKHLGPVQDRPVLDIYVCLSSVGEGASDYQILQVLGEAWRLGLGAELRHHRSQQPLLEAALHRQRQLRSHVSA